MIWRAALLELALVGQPAHADVEVRSDGWIARFENATNRYGHGIMGNLCEWGRICLYKVGANYVCTNLGQTSVFEDMAPRLHDMDGDGRPEAIVVESSVKGGAALAIYRLRGKQLRKTKTPEIGTRNRWLAPIGVADFDGDGHMDVAYIDRPHLARTLRVWSYRAHGLVEIATKTGLTNHRIGETFITGGVRDCGQGPEMITVDATWSRVMSSRLTGTQITSRALGPFKSQADVKRALDCTLF
jgi:hypothetical protein